MRVFKFFFWTLLALTLPAIVILGVVFSLTGTDKGIAYLNAKINRQFDNLQLDNVTGNLGKGLSADYLQFENEELAVKAEGVSSAWQLNCLLKKRVCFNELIIDRLTITKLGNKQASPETERDGPIVLPTIDLPVNISIDNVRVNELHYKSAPDSSEHVVRDMRLSAKTRGTTLQIIEVSAQYKQFSAALFGTVELVDDYPVGLSLIIGATDIVPDTVSGGEGKQSLITSTKLSDSLTNLTINTTLTGAVRATVTAVVHPLDEKLPLTATIVSNAIGWPLTDQARWQASRMRVELDGDTDDFRFSLQTQLSGEQIPSTDIRIDGLANPQRITVPSATLDTLNGQARGSLIASLGDTVRWDTQWTLADIDPSFHIDNLPGSLDGRISANGQLLEGKWSLRLEQATIEGTLKDYPLLLDTRLSKGLNNIWLVEHLRLNNEQNQIKAQGVVDDRWDLQADITMPNLENLLPGLSGGFSSEIVMDGELLQPSIRMTANAQQIKYKDTALEGLRLNTDIDQLFTKDSQLDMIIDTVKVGENAVTNTSISFAGNRKIHALLASAQGPENSAIDLKLTGTLQENVDWNGLLASAAIRVPEHRISLSEPVGLSWRQGSKLFSIDAHCWSSEESRLCLDNKLVSRASTQATISLNAYKLQRLKPLLPESLRLGGTLAAKAVLSRGPNQPGGLQAIVEANVKDGNARVADVSGSPVTFSYEELSTNTTISPENVSTDLKLIADQLGKANVSLQFDPGDPAKAIKGKLDLTELQLAIAQAFLPDLDHVSGTLDANGALSGRLSAPQFNGALTVNDPVLKSVLLPLPITGGQIVANFTGQNLTVDGELLSEEGVVTIEGAGSIKPKQWYAKARLIGNGLAVRIDPVKDSLVNPDITISVNPRIISVRGDINVPMAIIDVEELPEGAQTISSDVVIVEDQGNLPRRPDAAIDKNMSTQLNVKLGDDVQLSAYGLSARLEGDLDVLLRAARPPQYGGEISVVDGIYKKYGQDLTAKGQILFVGPLNNTRLAIDAVRDIDLENRTAGVRIQGTVAKPEITLFTNPADKSQDAILSYVVLGRDINDASDQDANLLAAAALALTVRGSRNLAGDIANALGVEDFTLETQGSGDNTELLVSGRLNDRLLLRYGRGVFDAQNTLYLRYDLTKKLYLEAAQGAVERAVDLFYSFSF